MGAADPVERWRRARDDPSRAVLEGFHPVKHALRFGAEILEAVSPDPAALLELARSLAPDLAEELAERVEPVEREVFERLAPRPPETGVAAIARRPDVEPERILDDPSPAPAILLERPRRMGNVGAVIRVAAAAGAAGVLTTGRHDPWNPAAVRGAAGLHWAVPVARIDGLPASDRPVVALDPRGDPLDPASLPSRALLAFGSERHGLGEEALERADRRVAIPMRPGISSLNLATAVAIVLYAWRLRPDVERRRSEGDIGREPPERPNPGAGGSIEGEGGAVTESTSGRDARRA